MNDYSKQIGETLAETLSELFALDDLGIPLNEIRDLKTLQGHMKAAEAKYGKKHPKYATLANLHAKKTAAEARKKERHARIKTRQEYHAKNYGYKRVKGTDTWKHESGHTLNFGADRSWSHMKAGGKRPKGGGATPIRDLRNHLAKLHEGVDIVGDELNEIRSLEKLRMQANQALLKHDPIAQQKLQRALQLQQRKRGLLGTDESEVREDEEQDRNAHREKLRQEYLAKMKPKRDAEAADEWTRKHHAAETAAAKKKADEKSSALAKGKSECSTCKRGGPGPSHEGSAHCRSGSIASGGKKAHCSCDTCY